MESILVYTKKFSISITTINFDYIISKIIKEIEKYDGGNKYVMKNKYLKKAIQNNQIYATSSITNFYQFKYMFDQSFIDSDYLRKTGEDYWELK